MSGIPNLQVYDPASDIADTFGSNVSAPIHIRIQQRNGRKTLTTVQGINGDYDFKKIAKACKKLFACNGTVIEDEQYGEVIQLTGDQRQKIAKFLVDCGFAKADTIKVHGF